MRALDWFRDEYMCPCGCGLPKDVAQDPATEGRVEVPPPTRCHVTTATVEAQRAYGEKPGARPHGLMWSARVRQD
jgi:hypothetical protein